MATWSHRICRCGRLFCTGLLCLWLSGTVRLTDQALTKPSIPTPEVLLPQEEQPHIGVTLKPGPPHELWRTSAATSGVVGSYYKIYEPHAARPSTTPLLSGFSGGATSTHLAI
jgi:hypothetical protein